jgi:tetratricopeptide (TPR) repeat protein
LAPVVFGIEGWKEFGDVADCYHGMLTRPGMFEMYRRAKIAIAPADWASMYSPMVKLRTLEITSCACFQLCETAADLADYYLDGEEIVTYKSWEHLADLIRHYLTHDEERKRIARAGFDRTLREHVWTARWSEIEAQANPVIERIKAAAAPGPHDPDLAQELSLSACALYHERFADFSTALGAYDEWLKISPDYFTALTGKARTLFQIKDYVSAERMFQRAVDVSPGHNPLGIDTTVTRRNVGQRMGLGKLFSGIFPREIECYAYLFIVYALQNREADAEALLKKLEYNPDVMFVSLVTLFAEVKLDETLGFKYLARYAQALLEGKPFVWEGERVRHAAHLLLLRGQALANLGFRDAALQALTQALSSKPNPTVEAQIRQTFAAMGLVM